MIFKRTRKSYCLITNRIDLSLDAMLKEQTAKHMYLAKQFEDDYIIKAQGYQESYLSSKTEADAIRKSNPLLLEELATLEEPAST